VHREKSEALQRVQSKGNISEFGGAYEFDTNLKTRLEMEIPLDSASNPDTASVNNPTTPDRQRKGVLGRTFKGKHDHNMGIDIEYFEPLKTRVNKIKAATNLLNPAKKRIKS
jgi:hypothetical protein